MTAHTISSPAICPPLGAYGGSAAAYVRGKDPFHPDVMPSGVRRYFRPGARKDGWLAEDAWGNPIGFIADGTTLRGGFMNAADLCEGCNGRGHLLRDADNAEHTGMANPCKACGGKGTTASHQERPHETR